MKFLKLTLVAIFSIALLTAVLPSNETASTIETTTETPNHELKTTTVDLVAMIDRTQIKAPTQG